MAPMHSMLAARRPLLAAGKTQAVRLASRWWGAGLDLVYPPHCALCEVALESSVDGMLCATCRRRLVASGEACSRCGASASQASQVGPCPQCQQLKLHFDRVLRLGTYEGMLRSAVLRIKQPRERPLAIALGALAGECLGGDCEAWKPDAVVPVPMHWSRKLWRGANSPEVIGEVLARRLHVPLAGHLLVRRKRTAPQASLSVAGRRANVKGAFGVRKHRDLAGARLLLIDDIMTTGATLNEAAKTLRRGGASSIAVAVLARAEGLV